jgi:ribose/xylose/arabinose/galactoside ABC-type transport system permease subunit
MALGFALVVRGGGLDLSLWTTLSAAAVLGAGLINAGLAPLWALGLAVAFGAGIGAVNGLLAAGLRLPTFPVTAAVGIATLVLLGACCGTNSVRIPDETFDGWVAVVGRAYQAVLKTAPRGPGNLPAEELTILGPLLILRMLIVAAAWATVLVVLAMRDVRKEAGRARRRRRFRTLVGAGALAGLAGACTLLDTGRAPIAERLIDGLAVPTAAVLAGAGFLRGRGRSLQICIWMPMAMFVTLMWRQQAFPHQIGGYSLSLLFLCASLGAIQLAFLRRLRCSSHGCRLGWTARAALLGGLAAMAASFPLPLAAARTVRTAALFASTAGLILLAVSIAVDFHARRRAAP